MFINNIKFNFNVKILDDLFSNQKYEESILLLQSLSKKNHQVYLKLLNYTIQKYLKNNNHLNFFKKKFVWINSFDFDDTRYFNKFLNYYFSHLNSFSYVQGDYTNLLSSVLEDLNISNIPKEISFDEIVLNSYLFQMMMLMHYNKDYIVTNNQAAFFETKNGQYLIYPQSTKLFFHILRNPYELFSKYKSRSSGEEALNQLCNFTNDKKISSNTENLYKIEQNIQSWNINAKSWLDDNVLSTYRGKLILYEDLKLNTEETLISSLYHLKQQGIDFEVNFELVKKFIKENSFETENINSISNKEKKMVDNNLDYSLIEKYQF
mgnify:CR=1 FL=1|tara:strand:- start:889 stop:1851 length:963 start_codon:yes stop_codon:yes gene_type:complete